MVPVLTVIAGPNGSGKSTFTRSLGTLDFLLDPDAIAREMSPEDVTKSALAAGREVLRRTNEYLNNRQSFAIETTLAGNGPVSTMRTARSKGFDVNLIYVALDSPERNIQRVRERVAMGGHYVPDEDVRRRYNRSLENLPAACRLATRAVIYDNSGDVRCRVLETTLGKIVWVTEKLPAWAAALQIQLA